jgi:CRISPR-associated protein Cmr3
MHDAGGGGATCQWRRLAHTSASGRGHSLDWPWPSTVLGTLRTAWGRSEEAKRGARFGPDEWRACTAPITLGRTLALRRAHGGSWHFEDTVWPVPVDALWTEANDHVIRLDPEPPDAPALGRDDDDARASVWRSRLSEAGKPLAPPRWWRSTEFTAWLAGRSAAVRDRDSAPATARRVQAHVGIRPEELTADEGVLFSHDVVETLEPDAEWAIGAEVTLPDGARGSIARAERRPFGEADARSRWFAAVGARAEHASGRVVAGVWPVVADRFQRKATHRH